jgi:AraC-like DNA-binding protein
MSRPKANIDATQVLKLAEIGCKTTEIANVLGCSTDTLERRFAAELSKGRTNLRISLRRWQLQAAQKGNVALLIWLGKQYLDQTEKIEENIKQEITKSVVYTSEWGKPVADESDT